MDVYDLHRELINLDHLLKKTQITKQKINESKLNKDRIFISK